ncbi:hypothetical protein ACFYWX_25920 [Streptomyces sp. NPDC002888]|uniref:hypothetical protein n=1 Tax=Streptomyces sp. NPDC002888 TaxID=3364668 RepID=UPI003694AF5B
MFESALTLEFLHSDGFSLETPFNWGVMVAGQEERFARPRQLLGAKNALRALSTLPLNQADTAALGYRCEYIQDILAHPTDDPFWSAADHHRRVADITVAASLIGGW